jgi:hypothetical protein
MRDTCSSRRRARFALAAATFAAAALARPVAASTDVSWIPGISWYWNNPSCWSGGVVPTNGVERYNVFLPADSNVQVNLFPTIDNLTLAGTANLQVLNGYWLQLVGNGSTATLANAGSIELMSSTAWTDLLLNGGTTQLIGGGLIRLQNYTRLYGSGTVVNLDNTIAGNGYVGADAIAIVNHGTLLANVSGATLELNPNGNGVSNTATLLAANGGILALNGAYGGGFNNTGGTFAALDGSAIVLFNNAAVTGGVFTTVGSGVIRTGTGHSAGIAGVTNLGNISLVDNSQLDFGGSIVNNGSINVLSTTSWTNFNIPGGTTTLSGGGTINLNNWGRIIGAGTLVNVDNLIHGRGYVGGDAVAIVNQAAGVINADISGQTLLLNPNTNGLQNDGTMLASAGGDLLLDGAYGGVFTNNGTLQAQAGSTVRFLNDPSLVGGTLATAGDGWIGPVGGHSARFYSVTNTGSLRLAGNTSGGFYTSLINSGSVSLEGNSEWTHFLLQAGGTFTLSGGGTIAMNGIYSRIAGAGSLENVDNTIRGRGLLGDESISIINRAAGLISADIPGGILRLAPADISGTEQDLLNQGTIQAINGGILQFTGAYGGVFTNQNIIRALDASTILFFDNASIVGGTLATAGSGSLRTLAGHSDLLRDVTLAGHYTGEDNTITNLYGTFTNLGSLDLDANGAYTWLNVASSTLTLLGGGTINLNSSHPSGSYAVLAGSGTLVNVDNVIRGQGQIGAEAITVVNQNLIRADVAGRTLLLNPNFNGLHNSGTLLATNGATLQFSGAYGGDFQNNGGTIQADDASEALLTQNAAVIGGMLSTSGSGSLCLLAGQNASLTDLTNAGRFVISSTAGLYLYGNISNTGSITVAGAPDYAWLRAGSGATVTLNGGGTVHMNGPYARVSGGGTLVNADNTIRGQGAIGDESIAVVNQPGGVIDADVSGQILFLNPNINGLLNQGLLRASNGGILRLLGDYGGAFTNAATISASGGSEIQIANNAQLSGGTVTTDSASMFRLLPSHTAHLSNLTLSGRTVIDNAAACYVSGAVSNLGSILVDGSSNYTYLCVESGSAAFTGNGTVNLAGPYAIISGGGTFINAGNTIRGFGYIGANAISVINEGAIIAEGGVLDLDPVAGGLFINSGTLMATSGGTLQFNGAYGGTFTGPGWLSIDADAGVQLVNNPVIAFGNVLNNGAFNNINTQSFARIEGSGSMSLTSGTLTADVLRQHSLSMAVSTRVNIRPNGTSSSTSRLESLSMAGADVIDLADNDLVIDYTGTSPYATIKDAVISAWHHGAWDGYGITTSHADALHGLGYAEASDAFYTVPAMFSGVSIDDSSILLKYTFYGDANLDGAVDLNDLYQLATHWKAAGDWVAGDFNYDGIVNVKDLTLLAINWQAGVGTPISTPLGSMLASLGLPQTGLPEPIAGCIPATFLILLRRSRA